MEKSFYEKEFLDYLNQNGKENYRIFNSNESDYTLLENELISQVSSIVDILVAKMSQARNISPEIHVFCVKDDTVNAFCFVKYERYYIGIHSATYVKLIRNVQSLTDYLGRMKELQFFQNIDFVEVQALLWNYAFKMIVVHEYMHIILGHCDTVCAECAFLWENSSGEENNIVNTWDVTALQAMEMFADEFSAVDATVRILSVCEDDIEKIMFELLMYYLAVLLVFSIFIKHNENDVTHPKVGFRLHSIMLTVDDKLGKGLDCTDSAVQVERIDSIIDTFMEIIQQIPELFSYDIVTDLVAEDFYRQYIELFNRAADVVKVTNLKAIYPVSEFEKMDLSVTQQVDSEINTLFEAQRNGLSYEDACKLIKN